MGGPGSRQRARRFREWVLRFVRSSMAVTGSARSRLLCRLSRRASAMLTSPTSPHDDQWSPSPTGTNTIVLYKVISVNSDGDRPAHGCHNRDNNIRGSTRDHDGIHNRPSAEASPSATAGSWPSDRSTMCAPCWPTASSPWRPLRRCGADAGLIDQHLHPCLARSTLTTEVIAPEDCGFPTRTRPGYSPGNTTIGLPVPRRARRTGEWSVLLGLS